MNLIELGDGEITLRFNKYAPGDEKFSPAYHFYICKDGEKVGICDLRIGHNELLYYGGNIGYTVYEEHRGHHYAGKACMLLFQFAEKLRLGYVIITCDPENTASAKTCEYAGCEYIETVKIPKNNNMYFAGSRRKHIFKKIL